MTRGRGRPKLASGAVAKPLTIRLDQEHRDIVKTLAREPALSRSEVVRAALLLLWAETAK